VNIKLFTDEDTRENVLKHIRGGYGICYEPPTSQFGMARKDTVTPSSLRDRLITTLSPLLPISVFLETLTPCQTYSQSKYTRDKK